MKKMEMASDRMDETEDGEYWNECSNDPNATDPEVSERWFTSRCWPWVVTEAELLDGAFDDGFRFARLIRKPYLQ